MARQGKKSPTKVIKSAQGMAFGFSRTGDHSTSRRSNSTSPLPPRSAPPSLRSSDQPCGAMGLGSTPRIVGGSTPVLYKTKNNHSIVLQWIRDNYELADGVCLPRCTLYEHFVDFSREIGTPAMNAASFGKCVRSVFPDITIRRLGIRGQSKYHYYGLGVKKTSKYYPAVVKMKEHERMLASGQLMETQEEVDVKPNVSALDAAHALNSPFQHTMPSASGVKTPLMQMGEAGFPTTQHHHHHPQYPHHMPFPHLPIATVSSAGFYSTTPMEYPATAPVLRASNPPQLYSIEHTHMSTRTVAHSATAVVTDSSGMASDAGAAYSLPSSVPISVVATAHPSLTSTPEGLYPEAAPMLQSARSPSAPHPPHSTMSIGNAMTTDDHYYAFEQAASASSAGSMVSAYQASPGTQSVFSNWPTAPAPAAPPTDDGHARHHSPLQSGMMRASTGSLHSSTLAIPGAGGIQQPVSPHPPPESSESPVQSHSSSPPLSNPGNFISLDDTVFQYGTSSAFSGLASKPQTSTARQQYCYSTCPTPLTTQADDIRYRTL